MVGGRCAEGCIVNPGNASGGDELGI